MLDPETLPAWLTEQDIDYYTSEFERTGFSSGLNWYRTIDKSCELIAAWTGALVRSPALYIAGERDLVVNLPGSQDLIAHLRTFVPNLRAPFCYQDVVTGPSRSVLRRSMQLFSSS